MSNEVIQALSVARPVFPELRVGQLIDNAIHYYRGVHGGELDLFYILDEELARAILTYCSSQSVKASK